MFNLLKKISLFKKPNQPKKLNLLSNPFRYQIEALSPKAKPMLLRVALDQDYKPWFNVQDLTSIIPVSGNLNLYFELPAECRCYYVDPLEKSGVKTRFVDQYGLIEMASQSMYINPKHFIAWVKSEVLPELNYIASRLPLSIKDELQLQKSIEYLSQTIVITHNQFQRQLFIDRLMRYCDLINQKCPSIELLEKIDIENEPDVDPSGFSVFS